MIYGTNEATGQADENGVTANYTVAAGGDTPAYQTVTLPYEEELVSSQGKFVVEDVEMGGLSAVWKTSSYGMTANGNRCTGNVESWFVSPLIDAANAETVSLTFQQNVRYFASTEVATQQATLWIREGADGEWTQLTIPNMENVNNNNFTEEGDIAIDLNSYANKTFQLGFKYTATTTNPGRWEVKNLKVTATEAVVKQDANLSYAVENFTANIGEENDFPVLTNPNDLEVSYRTTNADVATVDADGTITLLTAGQTTIIAEFAGNEAYNAGQASYQLVVKEPVVAGTDKYELVLDDTTLAADEEIILVGTTDEENFYAMSTTQNGNNRAANAVTVESDGTIIPGSDIEKMTIERSDNGLYLFKTSTGYLYAASSKSNWMRTEEQSDDNAIAEIAIDATTGEAAIVFTGENTRNNMRFNPNNGNPLFACYAANSSVANLPRIYRKATATTYDVTMSSYGLATFYWSDKAFTLPEGLTAASYTYDADTKKLTPSQTRQSGEDIPANEAVVLKGEANQTYTLTEAMQSNAVNDSANRLRGIDEEGSVEIATALYVYYWLGAKNGVPGFYYGAENGGAFVLGAHKAFLPLSEDEAAEATGLALFDVNAINAVEQAATTNNTIYNLNGQKVNAQYKGVVIVNGKKQIRK